MEGSIQKEFVVVGMRVTTAAVLAVFLLLGLPLLASAVEREVVINEIMWDGVEYVELLNTTEKVISLAGWTLTRQQAGGEVKEMVAWEEGDEIAAGEYLLLERNEGATSVPASQISSKIILVNTGELVSLLDEGKQVVDQANRLDRWYAGEDSSAGVAMERTAANSDGLAASSWHTSTGEGGGRLGTPGQENSAPHVNIAPEAVMAGPGSGLVGEQLLFTAEDSSDPEGDDLTYEWVMGDDTLMSGAEITHSYKQAGKFLVEVTVSDGQAEDKVAREVVITEPKYSDDVIINEFLPDPAGSDSEGEFMELKNLGSGVISLAGWRLDDGEGGSAAYVIPAGVQLGPGEIRLFKRAETKIALNNSNDSVRLLDPAGKSKAEFSYQTTKEGFSFNWQSEGKYVQSTTPTPGTENNITAPADKEQADEEEAEEIKQAVAGKVAGTKVTKVDLRDLRQEEKGTVVEVEGVVSVPPGVLGDKLIYLAGSGVQVYFFPATWPKLKLGDRIKITGEVSSIGGETRLKLKQEADMSMVGSGDPPQPHVMETGEVGEEAEGWLVTVQGQVTETSGDTFYIDDGSGEVKVYIKTSTKIDKPKMKKGMAVTVTGVVSETSSGYRVLPRWQEDVRLGLVAGLTSFPATGGTMVWLVVSGLAVLFAQAIQTGL